MFPLIACAATRMARRRPRMFTATEAVVARASGSVGAVSGSRQLPTESIVHSVRSAPRVSNIQNAVRAAKSNVVGARALGSTLSPTALPTAFLKVADLGSLRLSKATVAAPGAMPAQLLVVHIPATSHPATALLAAAGHRCGTLRLQQAARPSSRAYTRWPPAIRKVAAKLARSRHYPSTRVGSLLSVRCGGRVALTAAGSCPRS